jgi:hypothetical protein
VQLFHSINKRIQKDSIWSILYLELTNNLYNEYQRKQKYEY